jgi:hypothetical protein
MLVTAMALMLAASPVDGTWASDHAQCRHSQADEDAPVVIRQGRLSEHEADCRFGPLKSAGPGQWVAHGSCVVEGHRQGDGTYRFQLRGQTLKISEPDAEAPRVLHRCPGR